LATALAAAVVAATCCRPALRAQAPAAPPPDAQAPARPVPDPYPVVRNVPGDARPIVILADEVTTWTDRERGGERLVVLLSGKVLVEQNVIKARFQEGVAWVDLRQYRETGQVRMRLYAEGQPRVDNGLDVKDVSRAVLDVTTRGEFRLAAARNKMSRQPRPDDPLVQRARAAGVGPALAPPAAAQAPALNPQPPIQPAGLFQQAPNPAASLLPDHLRGGPPPPAPPPALAPNR
jgi:hypothetical protein